MWWSRALLLLGGLSVVRAQASNDSTPVGEGSVVSGNYSGRYRPQIHYTPPRGFMNDPNGMFLDHDGVYHLYYQYNPTDTIAGNTHWGHATSRDLYTWTNQPIPLAPFNSTAEIFSGSAVVDVNNTSGFFPNQTNGVIAYYTIAGSPSQTQGFSYSYDGGYSFIPYAGNPTLDVGLAQFRDPKVFYHAPTARWVMVIAFVDEYEVGIYTSPNLVDWTLASHFTSHGLLGNQWECPNLVQMPMEGQADPMWLMYVSIQPAAPRGGSIGQYFPGSFNGTHFTAVDGVARLADFGKDNYATQFFDGIPGDRHQISVAWASNWEYCNYAPTGPAEGWQSAMSLPRVNYLKNVTRYGYALVSLPYGLDTLRSSEPIESNANLGNDTLTAAFSSTGGAVMLDVNITGLDTAALSPSASLNFTFRSTVSGESLSGGQLLSSDGLFYLDRRNTRGMADNPFFTDRFSQSNLLNDTFDMQVVVDRSVWEVFLLGGTKSATLTYFPDSALDTAVVRVAGVNDGAKVSVAVYDLPSTWAPQANADGIVPSNTTAVSDGTAAAARRNLVPRKFGSASVESHW